MRSTCLATASLLCCTALAQARDVQVSVTDLATGHAIDAARIEWDGETSKNQSATTNDAGVATIIVPDKDLEWINLSVAKPGLVKVRYRGNVPSDAPIRLVTEPATRISGHVVDDAGHGIAGVTVITHVRKKYPTSNQSVSVPDPVTDADGRWTIDAVPAKCDAILQAAWSHLCLPERGYYYDKPYEPQWQLYDGSATLTLRPGTRVEGIVRDGDGKPVEGAKVYYNPDRRVSNSIPPTKTDAAGRFVFGIAPGSSAKIVIEHAGFGPAVQEIIVGQSPLSAEITLPKPQTIGGRVVDRDGKPVADATLMVRDWRGRDTLGKIMKTDAAGQFTWPDAPPDTVTADLYAKGFASQDGIKLVAGDKNEFQLVPPTNVAIRVIDAISGEPIKDFTVREGAMWHVGERVVWQGDEVNREIKRDDRGFTLKLNNPADRYVLRVEAAGHFAAETPQFVPDGDDKPFTLKLERGTPYEATVKMSDGSSVGTGNAYFVDDYLLITDGVDRRFAELQPTIGADGHLMLPPMREKGLLAIVTDRGVGRWNIGEWESKRELTIEPWAKVTGRIMSGNKPLANATIGGTQFENPNAVSPLIRWQYSVNTDADGRFTLDHVWPGELQMRQWFGNRAPGRQMSQLLGTVNAKAGETIDMQFGGRGRPIVGRLDMSGFGGKPWMIRVGEVKRADNSSAPAMTPRIEDDGQFRIADVPGGEYTLKILLHEWPPNEACGWGRMLGEYTTRFTVPPVPNDGYSDQPVEVGTLASAALPTDVLKVGDVAPAFELKTIDGQALKLADYRGKFVLLDFWAGWCAPCMTEMPNMKALRAAHANDPRLAIVGFSEDENIESLRRYVESDKIDWPQMMIEPESEIAKQYGATAIPQTALIDPDGKVIATGLRGEELSKAIEAALAAAPTAAR